VSSAGNCAASAAALRSVISRSGIEAGWAASEAKALKN